MKDAFCATLESMFDQQDTLRVLGDFNASTGTDGDSYETCWSPWVCNNQNSTKFLDFAINHGLRVAGSSFQRPQAHHWTWYFNAGGVAKEIDCVLVDGRWGIIQNCRVYQSAHFLNTDHRLVVATLKF